MKYLSLVLLLHLLTCNAYSKEKKYQLSQFTYKQIMKTQKFLDANNTKEAELTLKALENSEQVKLKLDKAYVQFYLGYFYILEDNSKKALEYFKEALALESLPPEQITNTYLNVIQLSMELEKHDEALLYLDKLIAITTPPKSQYYIHKASIYLSQKKYAQTIMMIDEAVNIEHKAQKRWLKMKYYAFYMQKQYENAILVMKELIVDEPNNKEYWLQLSSLYSLIDDYSKALSSLDISRIAKLDLKESEYLRLVGWLRHSNVPYKAAEILYKKIQSKEIQSSEKNLNYLGDLYYEAKAYDKAIKSYTQAAKIDNNGKIYYKIAQISMSQYKYQAVIENIKLSLKFENKEKLGDKYLLLGKTYYELKKSSQAKKAFENARKYKKSEKMANAWLKYIRF